MAAWLPAALLTDARVRWEPGNNTTAVLVVPFGADEDRLIAHFDPTNGRLQHFASLVSKRA